MIVLLMIMSSISEVISMGSIIPFLGVIASPDLVYNHELMKPIVKIFDLSYSHEIILPITIIFITAVVLSNSLRLLLTYSVLRLSYAIGADMSIDMYRRTLYQAYSVHVSRNSSEVINGIINKTTLVTGGVITPILYLVSSTIILIGILTTLFFIDPIITLISMGIFGIFYVLVSIYVKKNLANNSKVIAENSTQMVKSLQEGLGAIRDVLLDGSQEFYCKLYKNADISVRRASVDNSFISVSPSYAMEAIGVSLIAVLAYIMSGDSNDDEMIIPVLGVFAMGAQRLLPLLQQIYASVSTLRGTRSSFKDVIKLLKQPLPVYFDNAIKNKLEFTDSIKLENIYFRYAKGTPFIISGIDLTISKGDIVGFVGKTGSGKSTLIDIIMGLLTATSGKFLVDGLELTKENMHYWQSNIAHVPQSIYLSDSSILENIAFGVLKKDIDIKKAISVAKKANLFNFINNLPNGFETIVGEQGVQLSGGQKQRIGIARALYKKSKIIIFDEATSALDSDTEESVMKEVGNLGSEITVLIIAHRISTLSTCNKIIELSNDGTLKQISYENLQNKRNK